MPIATGRLNHDAACQQLAVLLGSLDHGQTNPVLDRAAGILCFQLAEDGGARLFASQAAHFDQRGVRDQIEHTAVNVRMLRQGG